MANEQQLKNWLVENNDEPYYIQLQRGDKISKWALYPQMTISETKIYQDITTGKKIVKTELVNAKLRIEDANQVQILKPWVIFDIDPPKTDACRDRDVESEKQMNVIMERLKNDCVSYEAYHTGNTGRHILVKYPELINYSDSDRLWLKREIIRKYAHDCNIDLLKTSSKTMIQMPNTPHRKTGKDKTLLHTHLAEGINPLPKEIVFDLVSNKVGRFLKPTIVASSGLSMPLFNPPCVRKLETDVISEGNRMNALFILLNHWKRQGDPQMIWDKAYGWVVKHDSFLTPEDLKKQIESVMKSSRSPGCRFTKRVYDSLGWDLPCKGCGG